MVEFLKSNSARSNKFKQGQSVTVLEFDRTVNFPLCLLGLELEKEEITTQMLRKAEKKGGGDFCFFKTMFESPDKNATCGGLYENLDKVGLAEQEKSPHKDSVPNIPLRGLSGVLPSEANII